jgi:hypothetical protein
MDKDDLKLCYVLKIGYDNKGQGLYEFIFCKDPSSIDTDACGWNDVPANGNADAPPQESIDMVLSLKTKKLDLICLHELNDRAYIDGYYTIHCLAYENVESDNNDVLYDETPLLVFHYGMKALEVKDLFLTRDIMLKESEIKEPTVAAPVLAEEEEEVDDEIDNGIDF